MRKPRSDSITAAVEAFRARRFSIPAHLSLRECDLPFWKSALACRDDWAPHELDALANLARCKADIERLQAEISAEGEIVGGKLNRKLTLLDTLTRRAMALSRLLQIHATATRGRARTVANRRPAPDVADDGLIPRS